MTTSVITSKKIPPGLDGHLDERYICVKIGAQEAPQPLPLYITPIVGSSRAELGFPKNLQQIQKLGEMAAEYFSKVGTPTIYIPSESVIYTVVKSGDSFIPQKLKVSNGEIIPKGLGIAQRTFVDAARVSAQSSRASGPNSRFVPYYFLPKQS